MKKEKLARYIKYQIFVLIVFFYAIKVFPSNKFEISFLDVDQGDAIFIKTPHNKQILIDGGPSNFVLEELNTVMPFFDKKIDLLILTHPDYDHISGSLEVLKRLKVENVLITGVFTESSYFDEYMKEIKERDINLLIASSESDFEIDDVEFDIIYPFENIFLQDFESVNNSSIVIILEFKGVRFFLGGDIEEKIEEQLIAKYGSLDIDVYKASHHGSKSSSSLNFMQFIRPEIVVVSVGKDNKYKHPNLSVLQNFAQVGVKNVYRTDIDGNIKFSY